MGAPGNLRGPLGTFGSLWDLWSRREIFEKLRGRLKALKAFGSFWSVPRSLREALGAFREPLGSFRASLGTFRELLGAFGSLWEPLRDSGKLLGTFGSLRELLGASGKPVEPSESLWEPSGTSGEPSGASGSLTEPLGASGSLRESVYVAFKTKAQHEDG